MKSFSTLLTLFLTVVHYGHMTDARTCRARLSSSTTRGASSTISASTHSVQSTHISVIQSLSTIPSAKPSLSTHSTVVQSASESTHPIPTTSATHAPTTTSVRTSSTSAPVATPPASSNSDVKRGLAYNDAKLTKAFKSSQASWAYNWFSAVGGSLPDGVVYFPMLWGPGSEFTKIWDANVKTALAQGSTHLLFLNEPDLAAQSNTSPQDAAKLWMQYMQPYASQATLVGPAITNSGSKGQGQDWLDSFLSECDKLGCTVHAIAAHIYSDASAVSYFKSYIQGLGDKYKRPVLMTEIGASSGTQDQQTALVKELVPFLDSLDSVSHYAWFMVSDGDLVSGSSLSPLGQAYVSS